MATIRQQRAAKAIAQNIKTGSVKTKGEILREVGYSEKTSKRPIQVTESKGFQDLLEEYLPDEELMQVHQQLLRTTRIDHMVFPLDSGTVEDTPPEELEAQGHGGALKRRHAQGESTALSDEEITQLLDEVGCTVRKIVHGETARHVYFWVSDAAAQKAAIELAYKIKGHITNKVDATLKGNVNVALVEFIGEEDSDDATSSEDQSPDTSSV